MKLLITGGAGFIGSHVVRLFVTKYPEYQIYNLDKLTYAGNLANLTDIENAPNYTFIKGDITDAKFIDDMFAEISFDGVIHLAAESHVDRSITDPMSFVMTNVVGTVNLLNAAKTAWAGSFDGKRFYHVSTDEVYGSLHNPEDFFTEETAYEPQSPYSASKAASDHFVRAYGNTYKLPVVLSNCSNNYGPNHFPEKLIPLMIHNIQTGKPLPVYGKGENVRDWLYVVDHARAIDAVFHKTFYLLPLRIIRQRQAVALVVNGVQNSLHFPDAFQVAVFLEGQRQVAQDAPDDVDVSAGLVKRIQPLEIHLVNVLVDVFLREY